MLLEIEAKKHSEDLLEKSLLNTLNAKALVIIGNLMLSQRQRAIINKSVKKVVKPHGRSRNHIERY